MKHTRHLNQRISQRGIKGSVIELLSTFGIYDGDKVILTKKNCAFISQVLDKTKKIIDKMGEKGGYTLILVDDIAITAYRNNSYSRNKAKEKIREEISEYM